MKQISLAHVKKIVFAAHIRISTFVFDSKSGLRVAAHQLDCGHPRRFRLHDVKSSRVLDSGRTVICDPVGVSNSLASNLHPGLTYTSC